MCKKLATAAPGGLHPWLAGRQTPSTQTREPRSPAAVLNAEGQVEVHQSTHSPPDPSFSVVVSVLSYSLVVPVWSSPSHSYILGLNLFLNARAILHMTVLWLKCLHVQCVLRLAHSYMHGQVVALLLLESMVSIAHARKQDTGVIFQCWGWDSGPYMG